MIHYLSPWRTGDIGGVLNDEIERLPASAWVCVRDGDTLFLSSDWGRKVETIVNESGGHFGLIGCMTNRLRASYQLHQGRCSDDPDIREHLAIAETLWDVYGARVEPLPDGPVAGMLMLFPRHLWEGTRFTRCSRFFDQDFTTALRRRKVQVGIARGLYLFHLYRWGRPSPADYTKHLEAEGL